MVSGAVLFGLLAMLAWGIWAVLADVATGTIPPTIAMIISYAASVGVAVGYVVITRGLASLSIDATGVGFALLAGVFSGIGAVAYYVGLEQGTTGVVTTISALYFVVAAILGILILGDSLDVTDAVGVGLAIVAVGLLAY